MTSKVRILRLQDRRIQQAAVPIAGVGGCMFGALDFCPNCLLGCIVSKAGGGGGWHMRETGAICQMDVLSWKRCILWALKRPLSSIWHYKNSECPSLSCTV